MNKFSVKLISGCVTCLAMIMLVSWVVFCLAAYPYIQNESKKSVKYLYELVQEEELEDLLNAFAEEEFDFDEENVHIIICDSRFRMVFTSDPSKDVNTINKRIRKKADKHIVNATPQFLQRVVGEPIVLRGLKETPEDTYYIYIYSKMKYAQMNIMFAQKVLLGVFFVVLVVFFLFLAIYIRRETYLVGRMTDVLSAWKSGDRSARISGRMSRNELAEVAQGMNELAEYLYNKESELSNYEYLIRTQKEDIAEFDVMQKRLFGKVTHHLKTPLAIVTSQLELEFAEKDPEKKKYYQESIMEEIEKMSRQISELLAKTKEYPQASKLKMCRANLSELLQEMIPKYENWFSHSGIILEAELEDGLYAMMDVVQMEHAINNYMLNAFSHTKKGKKVIVRLFSENEKNVIEVYNEGNCIPAEDMDRIWESYYQRMSDRQTDPKNIGLGLYIVKDIVRQHGGTCGVRNESCGVTFWIEI